MNRVTANDFSQSGFHGFRPVPRTGVIFVMTEAAKRGFQQNRDLWSNLGQGAPETSALPGAPDRLSKVEFTIEDLEYAPVGGLPELREAIAELYNIRFRRGKSSQYTKENVAICSGGRLALTRLVSTLGKTNIGHFLPDYTAYEELLDSFGSFVPIPILLEPERGYSFSAADLRREILGRGLSGVLLSNPSNPTGVLRHGKELEDWITVGRENECALIFDEFYSHYVYEGDAPIVSAAAYVENVDRDPVIIFDGLTKNWRYPGFRVSWTVGPKRIIETISSAGSFLDGGCSRPMQLATIPLVQPKNADAEAAVIREVFHKKRDFMMKALADLGIPVSPTPGGTFYCWGDLSNLPSHCNTGMKLFQQALEKNLIIVPGVFFDINPGHRRPDRASRFGRFARFSFGPPMQELERGMNQLAACINR
jgi:N-succinyldiaminopimelate aminotransferase